MTLPAWSQADVLAFLHGEAPLDGVWFGEPHPTRKGAYWWRSILREASPDPHPGVAVAWQPEDELKPWGCEIAFLRHLANDPAIGMEKGAMLRHCAKRLEATATPDVFQAYKTWPEDVRAKLSCHDLRRMSEWTPPSAPHTGEVVREVVVKNGFFAHDGDNNEMFDTLAEAKAAAQSALDYYKDSAPEGWNDNCLNICYGIVVAKVEITESRDATPDDPCWPDCAGYEERELVEIQHPALADWLNGGDSNV